MRRLALTVVVVMLASCGGDGVADRPAEAPSPPRTTTSVVTAPTTTVPAPTTTSVPPPRAPTTTTGPADPPPAPTATLPPLANAPPEGLVVVRYGPAGVARIGDGTETTLLTNAVAGAQPDHMGGLLLCLDGQPEVHWLKAGAAAVERLPYRHVVPVVLSGRPALVTSRYEASCDVEELAVLVDLTTAAETPLGCFGGEDGGRSITSGGGGHLLAESWVAMGSNGTAGRFHFVDPSGVEFDHPFNPVRESCAPCELDGIVSADGARLAYLLRPDAKWSTDLDRQGELDAMPWEEWWETSKAIPGRVVVVDLGTGEEVFAATVPAGWHLVDFDGRYLVLRSFAPGVPADRPSLLLDSAGAALPSLVPGRVLLDHPALASPPAGDIFPPRLVTWGPVDGVTVTASPWTLEGEVEVGAELIAVGLGPVPVDAMGRWSIEVDLSPGDSVVRLVATDPAGNTSELDIPVRHAPRDE